MKKIIFTTFFFLFTCLIAEAQWIQQNSGTNQNLYDIEFINEKTGWAVGDGGVILKTTNSGTNWINIPNPAFGKPLSSIHLVDSNNIYIVGWFETIIKSRDGGSNWIIIRNGNFGEGRSYDGLYFINKDTGWVCGKGYYILRTIDGGSTFDSSYLFWGELSDMYFKDFNNGIICADGAVFKTTNAGVNWYNTNVPVNGVFYMFNKLAVINNTVWIAGSGNPPVYRSLDFCETWAITDTIRNYPPSVAYCISFSDENTGWVGGSYGYLFKTTNGGYNWRRENTNGDQRFWGSIFCYSDSVLWGAGGAGKISYTTNGGQTMVKINHLNVVTKTEIFELYQNYPNPFNPLTKIYFSIPLNSYINLKVFDITGKLVETILDYKYLSKGIHTYSFNGKDLPSGVYYYSIETEKSITTKKMLMIK